MQGHFVQHLSWISPPCCLCPLFLPLLTYHWLSYGSGGVGGLQESHKPLPIAKFYFTDLNGAWSVPCRMLPPPASMPVWVLSFDMKSNLNSTSLFSRTRNQDLKTSGLSSTESPNPDIPKENLHETGVFLNFNHGSHQSRASCRRDIKDLQDDELDTEQLPAMWHVHRLNTPFHSKVPKR